ncbi:Transposase IS116/IS110/IS902 family protein [Actinokineospora iranica]|uniref:Transposase IS116/IS110/IS902 family protein n=1 Tax=Actinokineospora iranica TaxID=1271860 RepID=A0A1G6WBZ2_9PSEU|nr:Transposase IS116/IS110/IS902 family protein [Actinokineospora iranica]
MLVVVDQPAAIGASQASPTSTRAGRRLTPGTRSSSPTQPGPCRTLCARSVSATRRLPSWTCWSGSTTTWPASPQGCPTGSGGCSPASTWPWNARSARRSATRRLEILSRCGGPTGIAKACRRKLASIATAHAPRMGDTLITAILTALGEQTATAPADTVLPRLADSLKNVLQQLKQVATEVKEILDAHPLAGVLTSMPGIGVGTAARILLEIGDASNFAGAAHLAAHACIAPVTRRSRHQHQGRTPRPHRQPQTQTRVLPRRVRRPGRPSQQGLLRQKKSRRQETQRRPHLPRPPPLRRPVRHAPQQDPLPTPEPATTPAAA